MEMIFSAQRIENLGRFLGTNVVPNVRESFLPIWEAFAVGYLWVTENFASLFGETDLLIIAFTLASTLFISKKAFGWFKGMTK